MTEPKPKPEPTAFQRFADLARRIVAVPRAELQRKERIHRAKKKDEPTPPDDGKTPHERFLVLGKKVMAAPRVKIAELEEKWKSRERSPRNRTSATTRREQK